MGKSIANLYRYVEISKAITKRYLAAMPEVDTDKVPEKEIMDVSAPKGGDIQDSIYCPEKPLRYYLQ